MSVYHFIESFYRRRYLRGIYAPLEQNRCSCGALHPAPDSHLQNVELEQGSFVSNILWDWGTIHVTGELKNAFQRERFEGVAFEPTEIVIDGRPSGDRKKLPLDQMPAFYRVKLLTSIPLHPDFIELYDVNYCPECGLASSKRQTEPLILDRNRQPETDFFQVEKWGSFLCTERGKAFLENYPKTYCYFVEYELRD